MKITIIKGRGREKLFLSSCTTQCTDLSRVFRRIVGTNKHRILLALH